MGMLDNGDREDMQKSARNNTDLPCARREQYMIMLLEMARRENDNHSIFNLVPKWLNMFTRNDNSGSLENVLASGDSSIYFFEFHHHTTYFLKSSQNYHRVNFTRFIVKR